MPELGLAVSLVAVAAVYGVAMSRRWAAGTAIGWAESIAFLAGVAVVAVALVSPLDGAAHRSLWAHMVQHMLLISLAAPLLALGRPMTVVREGWPWRLPSIPRFGVWTVLLAVSAVQVAVLVLWHVPALYDAALQHDTVHGAEHLTLLLTAAALWMALERLDGEQAGLALLVVFVVSFPPVLLGAAMTFATTPWYAAYASREREALADQQLAGVVMWAYGALAAVVAGVHLFIRWLQRLEQVSPGRPPGQRSDAMKPTPSC